MATLIAMYNSEGCVGRCDAKCYLATESECTCICGGRNHGVGQQRAIENTQEMATAIIKSSAGLRAEISQEVLQPALF